MISLVDPGGVEMVGLSMPEDTVAVKVSCRYVTCRISSTRQGYLEMLSGVG